jgi:hypothetical protein
MAPVSWRTEVNEPRRMAWRVMTEKHSTRLSQENPVGVKCTVTRVFRQPGFDVGVLVGGVVVVDDVQAHRRVGGGDLLEEPQDLLVPVAGVAGVGDLAGGGVQGGEQASHPAAGVVVGLPLGDAGAHRQDRLAAFQSLALRLLIHAHDDGVLGGCTYRPTTSVILASS